ncbi:MAG: hypothetical protein IPG96_07335 [Proteobacteria bacterium]|nr:hypothetical protein [Pseudomonadota bacterium]
MLRALALGPRFEPARQVDELHRGRGAVDMLATGAAGPHEALDEVLGAQAELGEALVELLQALRGHRRGC